MALGGCQAHGGEVVSPIYPNGSGSVWSLPRGRFSFVAGTQCSRLGRQLGRLLLSTLHAVIKLALPESKQPTVTTVAKSALRAIAAKRPVAWRLRQSLLSFGRNCRAKASTRMWWDSLDLDRATKPAAGFPLADLLESSHGPIVQLFITCCRWRL